jgi:serine/threonine protein kinase/Tol biopolymer transport system component
MTGQRWQRLDQLFDHARQQPVGARAAFLARATDDEVLRTQVLSLLAADEESGEFLTSPAIERLAAAIGVDGWGLRPGDRLGAYTILSRLGAGGAGEVWRARDERLERDVAIKVLLPHFSHDAERVRRFAEEARSAGSLNHPNILSVYDVGDHRDAPFLVSEYLEGESLRKRLDAGRLPVPHALAIALGAARGLAAVHARGIIHRDLKPDNVFLRSDGGVKILDFGLAKLQLQTTDALLDSAPHTVTGLVLGTAAYMAPEQVRGEVDARSDLFALGATMYEMLGGERPFKGSSTFETLHAVLTTDPPSLLDVDSRIPAPLAAVVTRLLEKAPEARFQSAADLAWALEQIAHRPADVRTSHSHRTEQGAWRSRWLPWIAAPAVTATLLIGGWLASRDIVRDARDTPLVQFTWRLPAGTVLDSAPMVSPDGRQVAFVGKDGAGSRLFVRDLASLEAVMVPGTEGAKQPFWSPDSSSLGFFARGKLMKVALAAGAPVVIADAADGRGGAWGVSGTIVFSPDLIGSAMLKVSSGGGRVEPVTILDAAHGDNAHRWPVFLPDGLHFLYFVRATVDERRGVYLGRIDRAATVPGTPLFRSDSEAVYVPSSTDGAGDVLYVHNGRIEARRFDAARSTLIGDVRTLDFQASGQTPYHPATFSASAGLLAFTPSEVPFGLRLSVIDRDGGNLQSQASESQNWLRLSPDGRQLARQRIDGVRGNPDIWVEQLARNTRVRVTTAPGPDILLVWSPDGKRLAYVTGPPPGRPGRRRLTVAAADGTGILQTLPCPGAPEAYCEPTDWSSDGRHLIVNVDGATGRDVWTVAVDAEGAAQPLLMEAYAERDARVSPDGRWIAYVSEESGRPEVSVRSISGPRSRIVISGDGGEQPVWRRDGAEFFFVDAHGRLRSVPVRRVPDGMLEFGVSVELPVPPIGSGHWGPQYDVSPDGRRIYFMRRNEDRPPQEITVVTGWRSLLK